MVKIRLKRMGAKKHPFYRIVVADGRYPRNGKFIEEIGTYDPLQNPPLIQIDLEKVSAWMKNGAQPTDTVRSIIARAEGGFKKSKSTAKVAKAAPAVETSVAKEPVAETTAAEEASVVEAPASETPEEASKA